MASMSTSGLGLSVSPAAPAAAGFLAWNWLYAYAILSTRGRKTRMKLDNNVSPRDDIANYGEQAVKAGKITSTDLARLRRNEAAHANSVEGFTLFAASGEYIPDSLIPPALRLWRVTLSLS
jgi:hypothetical protein